MSPYTNNVQKGLIEEGLRIFHFVLPLGSWTPKKERVLPFVSQMAVSGLR